MTNCKERKDDRRNRKVWAHIDENKDVVVDLTRELVQIPSANPKFHADEKLNRESDAQNLVQSTLEVAGFDTDRWEVFPSCPNMIGEWQGADDKSLILCSHIDVVPVGDESAWNRAPFGGQIENGCIWAAGQLTWLTGGSAGFVRIPPLSLHDYKFARNGKLAHYYVTLILLILTVIALIRCVKSPFGRGILVLRDNPDYAVARGINQAAVRVTILVVSAIPEGGLYCLYL